jgi:hypothetical protein
VLSQVQKGVPSTPDKADDILAFPVLGTEVLHALSYGESLWGKTAKLLVRLPSGEEQQYFLKVCASPAWDDMKLTS